MGCRRPQAAAQATLAGQAALATQASDAATLCGQIVQDIRPGILDTVSYESVHPGESEDCTKALVHLSGGLLPSPSSPIWNPTKVPHSAPVRSLRQCQGLRVLHAAQLCGLPLVWLPAVGLFVPHGVVQAAASNGCPVQYLCAPPFLRSTPNNFDPMDSSPGVR